jgi:hypothetical protein
LELPEDKTNVSKYMIYLLTAIGLPPGGNSTVHIYTQTIHRTIKNKYYITTSDSIINVVKIKNIRIFCIVGQKTQKI